jgi:hypothetical protein
MKTLTLYELGVDSLPVEGSCIVYFDRSSSYGLFEANFTLTMDAFYMYGDLGDYSSLEEAIEAGHEVDIDGDGFDENGNPVKITLGEVSLRRGTVWIYEHDYYPVVGSIQFPFQTTPYFQAAVKESWIQVISETSTLATPSKYLGADGTEEDIIFTYQVVKFKDNLFKITWVNSHFHSWEGVEV